MNQSAERGIDSQKGNLLLIILKALRPHQWIKNSLLIVPLVLAHQLATQENLLQLLFAFISFSGVASAMYLVNDMVDLQADRSHPNKRSRPIASGQLSIPRALLLTVTLGALSLLTAFLALSPQFGLILVLYLVASGCYSLWLKRIAIVDVLLLASLYTTRILAGGLAVDVAVSEWLIAFSMFLFTSLAFAKRYIELTSIDENAADVLAVRRRGYQRADSEIIETMGMTSGYLAVLVLALYINSKEMFDLYHNNWALWIICVLLLYWLSRLWLLAKRGQLPDDPVLFAIKDRTSWLIAALVVALLLLAAIEIPGQSARRIPARTNQLAVPELIPKQARQDCEIKPANYQRLGKFSPPVMSSQFTTL